MYPLSQSNLQPVAGRGEYPSKYWYCPSATSVCPEHAVAFGGRVEPSQSPEPRSQQLVSDISKQILSVGTPGGLGPLQLSSQYGGAAHEPVVLVPVAPLELPQPSV